MGLGILGRGLVLEVVKRDGDAVTSLGTLTVPARTATALRATGGASLQLEWAELAGGKVEVLSLESMPLVPGLKVTP